jgi:pyrrolidone-carboxylate peptidase
MILVYAFTNQWGTNISRRVYAALQKLLPPSPQVIYQPIFFHPQAFFNKYIKNNQYELIIGLGDYCGKIQKIRLETMAHNVYGKNTIAPYFPISLELSLPVLDFVDTQKFSITEHMGTYNCNWIAYQTQMHINNHSPNAKQLFFHLPKKATPAPLATDIFELLQNNRLV